MLNENMFRHILLFFAIPLFGTEFYVAVNGNDKGNGSLAQLFATFEHARDAARTSNSRDVTIFVRCGDYVRSNALKLTSADEGTTWSAYKEEQVRLIGGQVLTQPRLLKNRAVLDRLSANARRNVVEYDLPSGNTGTFRSRGFGRQSVPAHMELFYQGKRMTVARWPNNSYARISDPGGAGQDDEHGGRLGKLEDGFYFSDSRPNGWLDKSNIWIQGFWSWDWANSYERIASIDPKTKLIRMKPPYGLYGYRANQRIYFVNILEELDQPGEYYVDARQNKLYFWPPAGGGEAAVSLLEQPLVEVTGASDVTFKRLVLEYTRGHGIVVTGGKKVRVLGCTLRNIGNYAAIFRGGTNHRIQSCGIYQTGDGPVELAGGDRTTLTRGGHVAQNNHIHHMGEWSRCYQPAFLISGVGNEIAYNLIHDGPHSAIQITGNEHLIEFNEIHHVGLDTEDLGGFYIGRDYTERGNIVRHNFFHHFGGIGLGSMAVYLDDCSSGTTVYGNIFYKTQRSAMIGGGRDNTVENNIFVECNMPVWQNMVNDTMRKRFEERKALEPPYIDGYPQLGQLPMYFAAGKGVPPEGNRVARNVFWGGTPMKIADRAHPFLIVEQDNLTDTDPLFFDAANMNFQLRDDSPAYKLGFQKIQPKRSESIRTKTAANETFTHSFYHHRASRARDPATGVSAAAIPARSVAHPERQMGF